VVTLHRLTNPVPYTEPVQPVTVRIPPPTLAELDRRLAEGVLEVRNRSEAMCDALRVWLALIENQEQRVDTHP
jgi:Arc/MetJ-type ribon-helix-helix transcriptional regulator